MKKALRIMITVMLFAVVGITNAQTAKPNVSITFDTGDFSQYTMMNDANHPWIIVPGGPWDSQFYIKSSNERIPNSISAIETTATYDYDGYVDFDAECMGEGDYGIYDKCCFYIDGELQFEHGSDLGSGFKKYHYSVTPGTHVFRWEYSKDNTVNPVGDYFAIDNIRMNYGSGCVLPSCVLVETDYDSAMVTWNGYSETYALRYKLHWSQDPYTLVEGIGDNTYTITGLEDGYYDVEVNSECLEVGIWYCATFNIDHTNVVEQTEHFAIWPNPASNTLHLEGVEGEMVRVFDNTGRMVIEQRYESQLDLSNLVPGIYAVNVAGRTMKFAKK